MSPSVYIFDDENIDDVHCTDYHQYDQEDLPFLSKTVVIHPEPDYQGANKTENRAWSSHTDWAGL